MDACTGALICACFAFNLIRVPPIPHAFIITHHPSLITRHSSFITHHFIHSTPPPRPPQARRNKYIMQEEIRKKGVRAVTQRLATSEADVRAFCGELRTLCKVGGWVWGSVGDRGVSSTRASSSSSSWV